MKIFIITSILFYGIAVSNNLVHAESKEISTQTNTLEHAVDFCPLSPLMGIYAIHYSHRITPVSELISVRL